MAFTILGYNDDPSQIRLFVEARLEAESRELSAVQTSEHPVYLGGNTGDSHPFYGEMRDVGFYSENLGSDELGRIFHGTGSSPTDATVR